MKKNLIGLSLILITISSFSVRMFSQTTEFTYQGNLQNGGVAATGIYDFEFLLFNAVTAGTQNGSTLTRTGVTVTNGIFSVKLDFGANFPGADRFLELHVKLNGGGAFTPLTPRQAVTSAPYSVTSLNAVTAGNVTGVVSIANGGTGSSTQNFVDLTSGQNIVGNKTFSNTLSADVVNAATQFNVGGNRILSAPAFNFFAGRGSGQANTSGNSNTFIGTDAGFNNTTGGSNSFFGTNTGFNNTTGGNNTLLGSGAGMSGGNLTFATALGANAFVTASNTVTLGRAADTVQVPGILNSATQYNIGGARVLSNPGTNNFFAGIGTQPAGGNGANNTFIGALAGNANTTGQFNTFVGAVSGGSNTTGTNNTLLGNGANLGAGNLINATALGSGAGVTQSDSLVLGNNANVGIGTTAPAARLDVVSSSSNGVVNTAMFQAPNIGSNISHVHFGATGDWFIRSAASTGKVILQDAGGNVGIGTTTPTEKLHVGGSGNVRWANSILSDQQGGSLEIGGTNTIAGTGTPFIDFHYNGIAEDYNIRLINESPGVLALKGELTTTGKITVGNIGGGGGFPVCFDPQGVISFCGSSLRYKQNINPFLPGMSLIKRLRPVTFDWRSDGHADMGLVAEEVAEVEPLLTTTNNKGQIEGVKYDRVGVVLVNAVNEQQLQIEAQQKQIDEQNEIIKKQRADLDALKALVCSQNSAAAACKQQN